MLAYVQYSCADQASAEQLGRLRLVLELWLSVADWYWLRVCLCLQGQTAYCLIHAGHLRFCQHLVTGSIFNRMTLPFYSSHCFKMAPVTCQRLQQLFHMSQSLCRPHLLQWVACLSAILFPKHLTNLPISQNNLCNIQFLKQPISKAHKRLSF